MTNDRTYPRLVLTMGALIGLAAAWAGAQTQPAAPAELYPVVDKDGVVYIDAKGDRKITLEVSGSRNRDENDAPQAHRFTEGLGLVKSGALWGFINYKKEFVIQPQFDAARPFREGMACVVIGGKYGFVDKQGTYIINPEYDAAGDFHEGMARVGLLERTRTVKRREGDDIEVKVFKWGFLDREGNRVIPMRYDSAGDFHEGLARVTVGMKHDEDGQLSGGQSGFMDRTGKAVLRFSYQWAGDFAEGVAPVGSFGTLSYVDKKGKFLISKLPFTEIYPFSEGLARVREGGEKGPLGWKGAKFGFIDKDGKVVVRLTLGDAMDFKGGLAPARFGTAETGRWGYIDKTGRLVVAPLWHKADPFEGPLGRVWLYTGEGREGKPRYGYVNKANNVIWHPITGQEKK